MIYRAPNAPGGFQPFVRDQLWHRQVVIDMYCSDGGGCCASTAAHAFADNVEVVLADGPDPALTNVSGSLLDGDGWKRDTHSLTASAVDTGRGSST